MAWFQVKPDRGGRCLVGEQEVACCCISIRTSFGAEDWTGIRSPKGLTFVQTLARPVSARR